MTKLDLTRHVARQLHRSKAATADALDALIHRMLKDFEHRSTSEPTQSGLRAKARKFRISREK